ncbi:hypothetical protein BH10PSE12_BH10PSE12_11230 [soil metagenome]
MHTITTDPERLLVLANLSGFMTRNEVAMFMVSEQAAAASLSARSGQHLLLVDASDCALQSQEVVAAFQHAVTHCALKARRIAVVTGPTLSRLQARRVLDREDAMAFNDMQEAQDWLFSPVTAVADTRHLARAPRAS